MNCCVCLSEGINVKKRSIKGKKRKNCVNTCERALHWWCHSCSAKSYRAKKNQEEIDQAEIQQILFEEIPEIPARRGRGRPAKDLKELHQNTIRKKFNLQINALQKKITELNEMADENNWGMELKADLTVYTDGRVIRKIRTNIDDQTIVDSNRILVTKLAYLKTKL